MLYVKESRAELSRLAQAAAQTEKYRPETCCVIGNYYSLKVKFCCSILSLFGGLGCCTHKHVTPPTYYTDYSYKTGPQHERAVLSFHRTHSHTNHIIHTPTHTPIPPSHTKSLTQPPKKTLTNPKQGQHERAVLYFQRALRLNRAFLFAWTLMGHGFLEMKNTGAAIEVRKNKKRARWMDPYPYLLGLCVCMYICL